ncbi:ABC transporter ATP-binding protein [Ignatzschineria indica]|uniref:ATP-binding protein n=1 Tax=Ignatzschineria indica TaxID=472583 RepID=A0A2U2AN84_9GAMM|nr:MULTISPECIES: ATP-binding cassette domain-containing protein [Ignatzschineria]OYQ81571.1 ATP-binding protein [Ignatzschineria sp. F8392]PWD84628.1 ATP-binding protein [Ignatzschineria indica]GGZ77930.1 ABC transporter ATP-binding protein [Ignatzschineria indica]
MLKLEGIKLVVGKGTQLERTILEDLSLEVKKGEFVVIIGGNGAGKSTVFNTISGFMKPEKGKILIDGVDVTKSSQQERAKWVSIVMQDPRVGTMENMTILENMAFSYKRGGRRGFSLFNNRERRHFFQEKLALLDMNLENRLNETVTNLSGGQRQALSLVMSIVAESKILLLDEITAALDPKIAENVMALADKLVRDQSLTCVMITHNMEHAIRYGDRTILLKDGKFRKEYSRAEKENLTVFDLTREFTDP